MPVKKLESVAQTRQNATENDKSSADYEILCWAISELEAREKLENQVDVRQNVNLSLQNRLVKLIGKKPLFDCRLNNVASCALWDTGSMISTVTDDWLRENLPDVELRPISDFLDKNEKVEFVTANNTEFPTVGTVVLNFSLGENCFPVPFLVTNAKMSNPILGFNVMEHLILSGKREEVIDSLSNSNIDTGKVNVMINLIAENFNDDDILGKLRASKSYVIPAKSTVRIRCNVKGDVKGLDLKFCCSAPSTGEWDGTLEITESLGELVRGKTPHVNIEVHNTTGTERQIPRNMILGEISAVETVIPIRLFKPDPENVEILNVETPKSSTLNTDDSVFDDIDGEGKWQPEAVLDHLNEEQRK